MGSGNTGEISLHFTTPSPAREVRVISSTRIGPTSVIFINTTTPSQDWPGGQSLIISSLFVYEGRRNLTLEAGVHKGVTSEGAEVV